VKLSDHFTLDEFTHSQTAAREGIDNDLPVDLYPTAKRTAAGLEYVRAVLNSNAILISSGYRSPALNAKVGGAKNSQHCLAEAVDFTCPTFGSPAKIVAALVNSQVPYDQLIQEFASKPNGGWVHISFTDNPRKMALVIDQTGTRAYA